jgi:hypothetical protein
MLSTVTAVFEDWHLPDGNYPAFAVGDKYRFSFEFTTDRASLVADNVPHGLSHLQDAEYDIVGRIVRQYGGQVSFAIVDSAGFLFYGVDADVTGLPVGTNVRLEGHLSLDHYLWVEYRKTWEDSPSLLYPAEVVGIRRVHIPERFIRRSSSGLVFPTSVRPADYDLPPESLDAVESEGLGFSLLDLRFLLTGVSLPLAFIDAA